MQLRLVLDCYDDMPLFLLGSRELRALNTLAETPPCCETLGEVRREKKVADHYGRTVAIDILVTHQKDAMLIIGRKA
jgi:hypothetical protein